MRTKIPKIYGKMDNGNRFSILQDSNKLFLEEKYLLEVSGISKKQMDLYLFRHKEILTHKEKGQKYININILWYVFKNLNNNKTKKWTK